MTPHINAKKNEIAKTVLMPGDPLRAKFIAENFLDKGYKLVNSIRNMYMYTGTYQGKKVTIAGSGMGCASIGIYSYELFKFYDVDNIIRVGSTGSYQKDIKLYQEILATSSYSDNVSFRNLVLNDNSHIALPSASLNDEIRESAKKLGIKLVEGQVHSSDVFYTEMPLEQRIKESQAICVEMETYALFTNAQKLNKRAACLLTVSDNLVTKEETSPNQRQTAFTNMMKIALGILK